MKAILNFLALMIVSSTHLVLYADAICYDPQTRGIQTGTIGTSTAYDRNFLHSLALRTAGLPYKLNDLTTATSGDGLIKNYHDFRAMVPPHYIIGFEVADRNTGIKYVGLEPTQVGLPYILTIAGTETLIDAFSDLNLGREQLKQIEGIRYIFSYCSYQAHDGEPYSAKNWVITGHSLGGGLAQAFAYMAQKSRMKMGLTPAKIDVITFNAFGASELVENTKTQTLAVSKTMSIYNYFLTGDLVSRIGTHIGQAYEVNAKGLPSGVIKRHALFAFWEALTVDGQIRFDLSTQKTPPEAKLINSLKSIGGMFGFLVDGNQQFTNNRSTQLNLILDATNILVARKKSQRFDQETAEYLLKMISSFLHQLASEPETSFKKDMINHLLNAQRRLR